MPEALPGATAAGEYLNVLLGARYRRLWERQAMHVPRTSTVQINAVAGVVARHLQYSDEQTADYRRLRNRIRGALRGLELTTTGLSQIIDAFAMTSADADQLWALARGDGTIKLVTGTALPPQGLYEATGPRRHETISLHEVHQVGPDRKPASHRAVQTLRAVVDDMDYYPVVFDTNAATVVVRRGGKPGRLYRVDDAFFALNIQFDQPLRAEETALLDYVTTLNYDELPPPELRRGTFHKIDKFMLEVRFDPAAVPQQVYWAEWDSFDHNVIMRRQPVELDQALAAHCYHERISKTIVGFCWDW
ncbi:MAG TPA: hypothetical protein VF892_11365 [Pseudonocardiaceae bacterium]